MNVYINYLNCKFSQITKTNNKNEIHNKKKQRKKDIVIENQSNKSCEYYKKMLIFVRNLYK